MKITSETTHSLQVSDEELKAIYQILDYVVINLDESMSGVESKQFDAAENIVRDLRDHYAIHVED